MKAEHGGLFGCFLLENNHLRSGYLPAESLQAASN